MKQYPVISFANYMVGTPFEWGENDCNTVTLKFLDMIMSECEGYLSITKEVVGRYSTPLGANRFYKKFHTSWEDHLLQYCDKDPSKPTFQAGDIIITPMGSVEGSHICTGGKSLSVDPELGTVLVPTVELLRLEDVHVYRPRR